MGPGLKFYLDAVKLLISYAVDVKISPTQVYEPKSSDFAVVHVLGKSAKFFVAFYYDEHKRPLIKIFEHGHKMLGALTLISFEEFLKLQFPKPGKPPIVAPAFQELAKVFETVGDSFAPQLFDLSGFNSALLKEYYLGSPHRVVDIKDMLSRDSMGLSLVMLRTFPIPGGKVYVIPAYLLIDFTRENNISHLYSLHYGFVPSTRPDSCSVYNANTDSAVLDLFTPYYTNFVLDALRNAKLHAVQ